MENTIKLEAEIKALKLLLADIMQVVNDPETLNWIVERLREDEIVLNFSL